MTLPQGLTPSAVRCLDVVLATPNGEPPATAIGFGGDPLFLKVQSVDLDGDGRAELRIRFVEGSTPFVATTVDFVLTPANRADRRAAFTVTATARLPDGRVAEDDRCLGGTSLAVGAAQQDQGGQPIRFPERGDALVPLPLRCTLATGCALDGGTAAVDGGVPSDAGVQ